MTHYKQLFIAAMASTCIGQVAAQEIAASQATRLPDLVSADTVHFRNLGLFATEALLVGWYGKKFWWREGFTGEFRTIDEGWFGQRTYAGGADKLGHFYATYVMSRLAAPAFKWAGNDADHAVTLGTVASLAAMMAVEVIDGYSERWRFSRGDAVMNLVGAGTSLLLQRNPALDRLLDFRMHYKAAPGTDFNPFEDYSGQTYLVAVKLAGIPALREHRWLRYVELVAGYGTRDFPKNRPNFIGDNRTRNVYAGISLNLSEVLGQTAFKNSPDSRARKLTNVALEFVQPPGTAVYGRHTLPRD